MAVAVVVVVCVKLWLCVGVGSSVGVSCVGAGVSIKTSMTSDAACVDEAAVAPIKTVGEGVRLARIGVAVACDMDLDNDEASLAVGSADKAHTAMLIVTPARSERRMNRRSFSTRTN